MFVRSDWTRRGLGRAILDSCARAAREEGFTQLALMATLPGEPLYRACADVEVAVEALSPEQAADAILAAWSTFRWPKSST